MNVKLRERGNGLIVEIVLRVLNPLQSLLRRAGNASKRQVSASILHVEALESRIVPATDTFTNPAGGAWSIAGNWSLERTPIAGDDVVIPNLNSNFVTLLQTAHGTNINSLTVDGTLMMEDALTVSGNVQGSGTLTLAGGQLIGATVNSLTVAAEFSNNVFNGVTLKGNSVVTGSVTVRNGLDVEGQLTLGNSSGGAGNLLFPGSQILSGGGSVVFGGTGSQLSASGLGTSNTFTIGQSITVTVQNGIIGGSSGSVVDDGTIQVAGSSAGIQFYSLSIASSGSVSLLNGASATAYNSLSDAGSLTLGKGCYLDVLGGSYTQASSGMLNVQLGGTPASQQFGQMFVLGTMSLAGTLTASYVNGFTPSVGQSWEVLNSSGLTGKFNSVSGGTVRYTATSVFLNAPGPPAAIAATSGSGQHATVGTAFSNPLVATVTDANGILVPGVSVTFSAPNSGAGGTFSNDTASISGVTGPDGTISETFTANAVVGTYTVTAAAAGVSTPASFSLTNNAAAVVTPTSLMWDTTQGGVDLSYTVSGGPTPLTTTVDLFWASGDQFADVIGGPITGASQVVTAGAMAGSYGPYNVPVSALGTPPQGANYLLAVSDPGNILGNFDPSKNVIALAYNRATQLVIGTQPQVVGTQQPSAVIGVYQSFQVQALAEDVNGNVDQFFNGNATIQFSTNPSSATLGGPNGASGTITVTAVNGKATFSGLTVNLAGIGDTLQAASNGLSSVTTNSFTIAFTPDEIRAAYGLPPIENLPATWSGAGQTIAIVAIGDDPTLQSDLNQFDSTFNLPPINVPKTNSSGQTTNLPPADDPTFENEEALDVEWAHAIAPGASIILVEANKPSLFDSIGIPDFVSAAIWAAEQPNVSIVESSFGVYDDNIAKDLIIRSYIASYFDLTYQNHLGVTFVVSSGDQGNVASYPTIVPDVISVGGTYLQVNSDGTYQSEQYWSGSNTSQGKSGGYGITSLEPEPSFQEGVQNTGNRAFPDVAFDGSSDSGVFTYTSTNTQAPWFVNWGTSFGAPCWAALLAVANEQRVAPGGAGASFNSGIYDQAASAVYDMPTNDFNLIGGVRYSPLTGLGTPNAKSLIPALAAWQPLHLSTSLQGATFGKSYSEKITAAGGSGSSMLTITPMWNAFPAGLTFDTSKNNELDITGTPTVPGSYSFSVTATDTNGLTATQNYTLLVYDTVQSVVINDGSAQRSMVNSITVTFSSIVNLMPAAFQLTNQTTGGTERISWATSVVSNQTVALITFSGSDIIGGSLSDGRYALTTNGADILSQSGVAIDAAGNGQSGSARTDSFFRLFGDVTGNGTVTNADVLAFRQAYLNHVYLWYFDYLGIGSLIVSDLTQIQVRLGKKV